MTPFFGAQRQSSAAVANQAQAQPPQPFFGSSGGGGASSLYSPVWQGNQSGWQANSFAAPAIQPRSQVQSAAPAATASAAPVTQAEQAVQAPPAAQVAAAPMSSGQTGAEYQASKAGENPTNIFGLVPGAVPVNPYMGREGAAKVLAALMNVQG